MCKRRLLATVVGFGGCLVSPLVTQPAEAAERHVPSQYPTIQAAIDAAVAGDEVIIAPGTYAGDGNRDLDFEWKPIIVRGCDPNDPATVAATVIDCQGGQADPHVGFAFKYNEKSDSVVAGLTIKNGWPSGIDCLTSAGPTIRKCVITECDTGIVLGAYSTILGCTLSGNRSSGIRVWSRGGAFIADCTISGNAADWGAGVFADELSSELTVLNCAVVDNHGPGVYVRGISWDRMTIENSTIAGNAPRPAMGASAGAIDCAGTCWYGASVTGCILWGNHSTGGWEISVGGTVVILSIAHSDVQGGEAATRVGSAGGEVVWGSGNLDTNPLFVPGSGGAYYLSQTAAGQQQDSPCVDAGPVLARTSFSRGSTRTDGQDDAGMVDMGYHYDSIRGPDFGRDGSVDLRDFYIFQACFGGPNRAQPCKGDADLDGDGDVDLADFAQFQSCFNGPNRPPACQ